MWAPTSCTHYNRCGSKSKFAVMQSHDVSAWHVVLYDCLASRFDIGSFCGILMGSAMGNPRGNALGVMLQSHLPIAHC